MLNRIARRIGLPLAAFTLLLGACDDPTEIDDHVEAAGFVVEEGGVEILRYMLSDTEPATLALDAGIHDVAFVMLDVEGQPIPHPGHGEGAEEEELQVTFANSALITWTPEAETAGEHHAHLEFHGELNAMDTGSTTMVVCVLHEAHCDFESVAIPVTIQ